MNSDHCFWKDYVRNSHRIVLEPSDLPLNVYCGVREHRRGVAQFSLVDPHANWLIVSNILVEELRIETK